MPTANYFAAATAYDGYIYQLGGCTGATCSGSAIVQTVSYAKISLTGALVVQSSCPTGWTLGGAGATAWCYNLTSLPAAVYESSVVAYNGYIYSIGGYSSGSAAQSIVNYAPINSNGSVGTWSDVGSDLPTASSSLTTSIYNGYIYAIGGHGGAPLANVSYAQINASGTLNTSISCHSGWTQGGAGSTAWCSNASSLPAGVQQSSSVQYNGYLYEIGGYNGGALSTVYYSQINSDGSIGTWNTTTSLEVAMQQVGSVAYNGYVYAVGGTSSSVRATVYMAPIYNNGTLGSWSTTTSLPSGDRSADTVVYGGNIYEIGGYIGGAASAVVDYVGINSIPRVGSYSDLVNLSGNTGWNTTTSMTTAMYAGGTVAYNNYLYAFGGATGSATVTNSLEYAPIHSNGTIGTWTSTTIPTAVQGFGYAAYNGYLYILGGINSSGTTINTTDYAQINSNGSIGGWNPTTVLPAVNDSFAAAAYNGYLYIFGGENTNNADNYTETDSIPINSNGTLGTSWSSANSGFSSGLRGESAVAYNGYMYILGGDYGGSNVNTVWSATINSGGMLSAWGTTSSFATTRVLLGAVAVNGYMYIAGGYNSTSGLLNDVQVAAINSNGTLSAWAAITSFNTPRVFPGLVTSSGYLFIFGGCSVLWTGVQADVQYYPLPGTNDVTPTEIVVNGTNTGNPGLGGVSGPGGIVTQSAIASNNCTAFGFPNTISTGTTNQLGVLYVLSYLPTNPCGISTDLGSYVWLHFELDDSLTATFPDIGSNHTSITNFSVYYHPASSNRLRGGATFELGSLQSLDAIQNMPHQLAGLVPQSVSVSPTFGQVATMVNISASSGLSDLLAVQLGSTSIATGQFGSTSDTAAWFIVPSGTTAGTYDVTVKNNIGWSTTSSADQFTAQVPQSVSVSPTTGQVGTTVNISATSGLTNLVSVKLGSTVIASGQFGWTSDTAAWFNVPSGTAAGTYDVTAENSIGWSATRSADQFTAQVPQNVSVSPSSGQVGTTINISASSGLSNLAGVKVGGVSVASGQFGYSSDTSAWFVVPSGVGTSTNNVTAENSIGWSATGSANQFTASAPSLVSVSPSPVSEGGSITLSGGGFGQSGDSITVHVTATGNGTNSGSSTASYSWNSLSSLSATLGGSGISGQMAISVSTSEGTSGSVDIAVTDGITWGEQPSFTNYYYSAGLYGNEIASQLMSVPVNMYVTSVSFYGQGCNGYAPTMTWVIWNSSYGVEDNGSNMNPSGGGSCTSSPGGQTWQTQSTGFYLAGGQQVRIGWWWDSGSADQMVWSYNSTGSGYYNGGYASSPGTLNAICTYGCGSSNANSIGARLTY